MAANSIKDPKMYRRLRKDGNSAEKSARISNAAAREGHTAIATRGGEAENYEERTVKELRERAKKLGISGYSKLKKADLIQKIRNH